MYQLRVPDDLADLIRNLHPQLKRKIKEALKLLIADPFMGKILKEELAGLRSIRVGRFRIVYRLPHPKKIHLVAIGPRDIIYQETYRLIQKEEN